MTEIAISFFIGFMVGLVMRPKDPELKQQIEISNRNYQKYEEELKYYKDLCKWHADQKRADS